MEALSREIVYVTVKQARNLGHHRKLFALLTLIFENQSHYPTVEDLLDSIKVYLGHAELMKLRDGREVYRPKSISFGKMDQTAFSQFYDRVMDVVVTQILPGIRRADLERELLEFTR